MRREDEGGAGVGSMRRQIVTPGEEVSEDPACAKNDLVCRVVSRTTVFLMAAQPAVLPTIRSRQSINAILPPAFRR